MLHGSHLVHDDVGLYDGRAGLSVAVRVVAGSGGEAGACGMIGHHVVGGVEVGGGGRRVDGVLVVARRLVGRIDRGI